MSAVIQENDALISSDENRQMFDEIVPHYDLLNRLMSLGMDSVWRSCALDVLYPVPDCYYLDIGCGTGDLSIAIAKREPAARALGIDPAEGMLVRAREKAGTAGVGNAVKFQAGDALSIDAGDGTFDGVVSGFCIRNITRRKEAFREMVRVTKPGGRIVLLELTMPRRKLFRVGHQLYNALFVRPLGWLLSNGKAYGYLARSIKAFPEPKTILEEMSYSGMCGCKALPFSLGAVTIFAASKPGVDPS